MRTNDRLAGVPGGLTLPWALSPFDPPPFEGCRSLLGRREEKPHGSAPSGRVI
jgi:hypothetical protein